VGVFCCCLSLFLRTAILSVDHFTRHRQARCYVDYLTQDLGCSNIILTLLRGRYSGPTDHTLRTPGSKTWAPSFIPFLARYASYRISTNSLTGPRNYHHLCRFLSRALHIFPLTPTLASSNVEHYPPTDTLAPSRRVEQAGSKPEDSEPGDEVEYQSEEFPISEDVIPYGVSVFMPDNFVKHIVVPRMSS